MAGDRTDTLIRFYRVGRRICILTTGWPTTKWLGFLFWLSLCLFSPTGQAGIDFPEIPGRVVDQAGILSQDTKTVLREILSDHEQRTSNQVVVVTVDSLQGNDIETFGYQLGRHWGIGQEKRNNGVLLIIAPQERKVRIEVGYGLEGDLTDARSHEIIQSKILPRFKAGDYNTGVRNGVSGILATIEGSYVAGEKKSKRNLVDGPSGLFIIVVFWLGIVGMQHITKGRPRIIFNGFLSAGCGVIGGLIHSSIIVGVLIAVAGLTLFQFKGFISQGGTGSGSVMGRTPGHHGGLGRGGNGGGFGRGGGGFGGGGGGFGGGGASGGW